jgi:hypothetical protein
VKRETFGALDVACHIVAKAGDKRALCGVKDPLPRVLQRWAIRHRYPRARCFDCYQATGLAVLFNLKATA